MKEISFIMVLLCVFACSCPHSIKRGRLSTMDLLTRKDWYLTKGASSSAIIKEKYNKRTLESLVWLKDYKIKNSSSVMYYLSDSVETNFKFYKVGKNKNGNYIINKSGNVMEIVKLNYDTLIVKAVHLDTAVYIGTGPLLYVTKPPQKW